MFFRKKIKKEKGFSLIELLVVVAIFSIISGVTIFNYGKFSSDLVVTNLAYQAAIAVREAQIYGISVKQASSTAQGNFNTPYGVWFSGSPSQTFYLFADKIQSGSLTVNHQYDPNENEETFGMSGSNKVVSFCVFYSSGENCTNDDGTSVTKIDSISIIFERPNPNAKIYAFNSGGPVTGNPDGTFDRAEVLFTSGQGDKKARMTVYNNGQISVDSCTSPRGKPCQI